MLGLVLEHTFFVSCTSIFWTENYVFSAMHAHVQLLAEKTFSLGSYKSNMYCSIIELSTHIFSLHFIELLDT